MPFLPPGLPATRPHPDGLGQPQLWAPTAPYILLTPAGREVIKCRGGSRADGGLNGLGWVGALAFPLTVASAPALYLDLDLIGEFFGEAKQLPSGGVQSLDHHSQPGPAFHPAMYVHGKVVLCRQP